MHDAFAIAGFLV